MRRQRFSHKKANTIKERVTSGDFNYFNGRCQERISKSMSIDVGNRCLKSSTGHMIGKLTSKENAAKRVGLSSIIIDSRGANTSCSSSHCNLNYLSAQPYRSWRMPKRDMKIERKLLINSHMNSAQIDF